MKTTIVLVAAFLMTGCTATSAEKSRNTIWRGNTPLWNVSETGHPSVITLTDGEVERHGNLGVAIQGGRDDKDIGGMIRVFGCVLGDEREFGFEGEDWSKRPLAERAAVVKAKLVELAESLAKSCHTATKSLDDKLPTFEQAFELFDRGGL
jgi:hypothetical protein